MKKIVPGILKQGDTIGIVAPASPLNKIRWENIVIGVENLRQMGFQVKFAKNVNVSLNDPESAWKRAEDLMQMFEDATVSCVMAAIGGYSSIELLPHLDIIRIKNNPKPFIGFSDITVLNLFLLEKIGLVNFYGPTFAIFCQNNLPDYTKRYFFKMLTMKTWIEVDDAVQYADDLWYLSNNGSRDWKENMGLQVVRDGAFEGECIGGNLESLLALAGTSYFPNCKDKVLFLEEADGKSEEEVRRKLMQLKLMGTFDEIKAVVFGRFWGWNQDKQQDFMVDITKRLFGDREFPVLANVDFGHSDPMITLPIGGRMYYQGKKLKVKKDEE